MRHSPTELLRGGRPALDRLDCYATSALQGGTPAPQPERWWCKQTLPCVAACQLRWPAPGSLRTTSGVCAMSAAIRQRLCSELGRVASSMPEPGGQPQAAAAPADTAGASQGPSSSGGPGNGAEPTVFCYQLAHSLCCSPSLFQQLLYALDTRCIAAHTGAASAGPPTTVVPSPSYPSPAAKPTLHTATVAAMPAQVGFAAPDASKRAAAPAQQASPGSNFWHCPTSAFKSVQPLAGLGSRAAAGASGAAAAACPSSKAAMGPSCHEVLGAAGSSSSSGTSPPVSSRKRGRAEGEVEALGSPITLHAPAKEPRLAGPHHHRHHHHQQQQPSSAHGCDPPSPQQWASAASRISQQQLAWAWCVYTRQWMRRQQGELSRLPKEVLAILAAQLGAIMARSKVGAAGSCALLSPAVSCMQQRGAWLNHLLAAHSKKPFQGSVTMCHH